MLKPLARYLLKQHLKNHPRRPSLVHGDLIDSMAVVGMADDDQSFGVVSEYVKELRRRGIKTVDFYVGFKSKKLFEDYKGSLKDHPFHSSSFSWMGNIDSTDLDSLESTAYDILIDLSQGSVMEADVILAKSKAKWKAGSKNSDRAFLLDFMIDMKEDGDIRNLIHHLDKYLMNFNKMNAA